MNAETPANVFEMDNFSVMLAGRLLLADLTLSAKAGEILTVLGRHGSGRETLRDVLAKMLPREAEISGTLTLGERINGKLPRFTYLANASLAALAPHAGAEGQFARILARVEHLTKAEAETDLRVALERLPGAPSPERLQLRPSALSPRERVFSFLALALAQHPDAILADDVTSGLDPTEADEFLGLLLQEQSRNGFALIYFTGDPHVPARLGGRVAVLRDGRLVEEGPTERMASARAHAYTQSLFRAVPRLGRTGEAARVSPRSEPLLQVRSLVFDRPDKRIVTAAEGITFDLRRGASLALIGKRGSGRRTIVRAVLGLSRRWQGRIIFDAVDMGILSPEMRARLRQRVALSPAMMRCLIRA